MPFAMLIAHCRRPLIVLASLAGFAVGALVQFLPFSTVATARADGHWQGRAVVGEGTDRRGHALPARV